MKRKTLIFSLVALFVVCLTVFTVYAANEKTLKVTDMYGADISVYVNGSYKGGTPFQGTVPKNAEIRLVNESDAGFLYYTDSNNGVLSREGEYTFTILTDTSIFAWNQNIKANTTAVKYMNTNDTTQILFTASYSSDKIASAFTAHQVETANKYGYEFAGWDTTPEKIIELASTNREIVVRPVYNKLDRTYTINVVGGTFYGTELTSTEKALNDQLTLVADSAPAGQKFAYWRNSSGAVISNYSTVNVYVAGNQTYTAVFVPENESVALTPSVSLSAQYNRDTGRVDTFAQRFCPEEYKIVTYGLLYAKETELTAANMTLDDVDGTVLKATSQGVPQSSSGVLINHMSLTDFVTIRAYISYKDGTGNITTVYSDVVRAVKLSEIPCDQRGEEHDFSDYSREGDVLYYYCTKCTAIQSDSLYVVAYSDVIEGNEAQAEALANSLTSALGYTPEVCEINSLTSTRVINIATLSSSTVDKYGWKVEGTAIELYEGALYENADVYSQFVSAVEDAGGILNLQSNELTQTPIASNDRGAVYASVASAELAIKKIYNTQKAGVLSTGNTDISNIVGTVYYVSNSGNDSATGISPNEAWATIANLNAVNLRAGDAVLFKRGDIFRGHLNAVSGVTYGSYGNSNLQKPVWVGSKQNYAGLWTEVEESIWKLDVTGIKNPGIMIFAADMYSNESIELVGTRVFDLETSGYAELDRNFEFYHGTPELTYEDYNMDSLAYDLYVYYDGNLNNDFSSIEIGEDYTMIDVKTTNGVVIDNICFKYNGGHAINGGGNDGTRNLTVTNSVFGWIGGSAHLKAGSSKSITRYGNAIQIYGSVDGFYIENNYIYEMFDTAITVQCGSTSSAAKDLYFANINVINNVMEKCFWGMEYWGYSSTEYVRAENINIIGNYIGKTGACWGLMGHNNIKLSTALVIDSIAARKLKVDENGNPLDKDGNITTDEKEYQYETLDTVADKTIKVSNNIFDRSYMIGYAGTDIDNGGGTKGYAIRLFQTKGTNAQRLYEFENNVFVQYNDQLMAKIEGDDYKTGQLDHAGLFDANTEEILLMYGAYDYMTGSKTWVVNRPADLNIKE